MTAVTVHAAPDGHRVWRLVGDPEPVLRATCPRGGPGVTCGKTAVTDPASTVAVATAVRVLLATLADPGCALHTAPPAPAPSDTAPAPAPAPNLDAALATLDPADLTAALHTDTADAGAAGEVIMDGVPVFRSGAVEHTPAATTDPDGTP